jgi:hypothetical protein
VCPVYIHQDTLPLVGNALGTFSCQSVALLLAELLTATRQIIMMTVNSSKDKKNLQLNQHTLMNALIKRPLNNHVHKSVLVVTGDCLDLCD